MGWLNNPSARLTDWHRILGGEKLQRGIMPSDIDGVIESNGHFLVFEVKRPGEETSVGQEIMLRALSKISIFTVVKIELDTDGDVRTALKYGEPSGSPMNPGVLKASIRGWIDRHS